MRRPCTTRMSAGRRCCSDASGGNGCCAKGCDGRCAEGADGRGGGADAGNWPTLPTSDTAQALRADNGASGCGLFAATSGAVTVVGANADDMLSDGDTVDGG